jgi:predicted nucleic acid-binding protein
VPEHALALLDTSCAIEVPVELDQLAEAVAVSTLTIAELALGLHRADPLVAATRETRYRELLATFDPVPYSARAAHLYGAIAASVRRSGRNPRPRRIDLMLALSRPSSGLSCSPGTPPTSSASETSPG